jgi:ribosomal-protein-alanine acetyltransferase
LAQFIFSEFCRTTWSGRPLVNAGDDWGLETLAWTKSSYRPVKLLKKYALTPPAVVAAPVNCRLPIADCELKDGDIARVAADSAMLQAPNAVAAVQSAIGNSQSAISPDAGLVIRPARRADLDAISALEQGCFNTYNLSRRQLQYLQQRQTTVFLVAEQGEKVVGDGIALVRHHRSCISGRVYSLAVDPGSRGQGIGEKLMREMIEQLRQRDVRRVYLEVEASNTGAIHLYERLGFASIGTLPDYYGEGRAGVHMMLETSAVRRPVAA